MVTLGFLKALEDQIGRSRGLREVFDFTVGTSAGKKQVMWSSINNLSLLLPFASFFLPLLLPSSVCDDVM